MRILFKILIVLTVCLSNKVNAQLSFATAVNYTGGSNPSSITSADFNNDGNIDLAEVNTTSNDLNVYFGSGTGSFVFSANYGGFSNPKSVIPGDFNGDGKTDLAIANSGANYISILIGTSTGTFAAAINYTVGTNPRAIASADFNNDGNKDLAVANNGSNNTSILLGTGTGAFGTATNYSVGIIPWAIDYADFNNDGIVDLGVVNGFAPANIISVLIGAGAGTFLTAVSYTVDSNPRGITKGDFNSDGNTDLAIGCLTSSKASILLGSTTGTFATAINYAASGSLLSSICSGDFNGDGKIDLATSNSSSNDASVLLGSGTGTFATGVTFTAGIQPSSITSADFNGDGKPDLATTNNGSSNISVLLNTSIPPSVPTASFSISDPKCVASAITFSDQSTYFPTSWAWTFTGGIPATSILKNPVVTYLSPGTYSAVLTASNSIGLSVSLTKTFVITSPTITVNSGSICSGGSFTIVPSGASTYTFSGGSSIVTPTINTSYSVTGTSTLGCISSVTAVSTVTVNPLPTLSVNSGSICYGTTFTIVPTGAATYTYSSGSAIVSPTITTTYSVTGTNTLGCLSLPVISTITVNPSTNITGIVTNTASVPVAGLVTLYLNETGYTKYDSITSIAITGSGAYTFTNAINANKYLIKAIPTATNQMQTYGSSSSFWKGATTIIHGCLTTSTVNITVLDLTPITAGIGSLSGKIEKGPGYGLRANGSKPLSTPIKGIIVKGGRNPGGNIIAQTTTDANGTYTISGLPNDNYFILVDIPGLDTNGTYHKVLVSGSETYNNLDFTVDSTKINPINLTVGIQEINISNNNITLFPNPTSNVLNMHFTLNQSSDVKFELFDVLGKSVRTFLNLSNQMSNSYETSTSLSDLESGIYFIKITINKEVQTVKICISK